MKLIRLLAAAMVFVASPAWADKYFGVTPSGATEVLFDRSGHDVAGALANRCMDARWTVVATSDNQVTCEAPLNMGQSILGQLAMGNSYSTPPRRFFRFNIVEINGVSRVQASGWMELQMAFGQVRRTDFSGPPFHNSLMGFMIGSGGRWPPGTTFPNHAVIGVDGAYVPQGRYMGYRVDRMEPGSAAANGGVQVGDIITRIANKRFRHDEDYLDATAQAAEQPTYRVEVLRNGRSIQLTLQRTFRPAIAQVPRDAGR